MGSKPCLVFAGDLFETNLEYMRLKNLLIGELDTLLCSTNCPSLLFLVLSVLHSCASLLLSIDFFRGSVVTNIRLAGLDHVMCVTALDGKVYIRTYQ